LEFRCREENAFLHAETYFIESTDSHPFVYRFLVLLTSPNHERFSRSHLKRWVTLAYLIFSHERVTCFNYHKVIAWFDTHGDHTDNVHDHSMDEVDEVRVGGVSEWQ